MDTEEKRQLVLQLADDFWPAKLVAPLSPMLDNTSFLYVDLLYYMDGSDDEPSRAAAEVMREARRMLYGKLSLDGMALSYSYAEGSLELELDSFSHSVANQTEDERAYIETQRRELFELAFEHLSEGDIRQAFAKFRDDFFAEMQSTVDDWQMRPL